MRRSTIISVSSKRISIPLILAGVLLFLAAAGCSLISGNEAGDEQVAPPADTAGTIVIRVETEPAGQAGAFLFTGVPTGTLTSDSTLVVADLEPGTYTTTEADPAPDFDVSSVRCEDSNDGIPSSGDPQTRTAVINLDAGETVTCTFINIRRGTAVIALQTEPEGAAGQIQFTGVPSGTIPANGTLVVADLPPGTYTSTERDPAPDFDLTAVSCDDGGSATVSSGDPTTRSAIFNIDPGEMVTCTFVNTRRGAAVIAAVVEGPAGDAAFTYTGVPTGTISAGGTLIAAELLPGTYTATEVDPAPEFELTEITCDDSGFGSESSGDPQTRSAIFNIDPGEIVTCTFVHTSDRTPPSGGGAGGTGSGSGGNVPGQTNPFSDPGSFLGEFQLPPDLPPDAGTYPLPLEGNWIVTNFAGMLSCGGMGLTIPPSPPETGFIEVSDDGEQLTGTGWTDTGASSITLFADPDIIGRFAGTANGLQDGIPVTIDYFWQVVTEEFIVGYLTSAFTSEGQSCSVYRPFELQYID